MSETQKVVIIGAPRSGTNMLRDVLAALPGVCTWPCDEINYIWRHGNSAFPDDEFLPKHATPRVRSYVRRAFESLARRRTASWIVEKTCANSLRVGFVDRILPDARYIFLVRDGRDALASAMKRWTAPRDLSYVLKKIRYVPVSDMPRYALVSTANRVRRWLSGSQRLVSWGPRFRGMQSWLADRSLAEVCAAQWERCVVNARRDLAAIEPTRVIQVKYEEFVTQPRHELARLLDHVGINVSRAARDAAVQRVTDASIGKGRIGLDEETRARLAPIIGPLLVELGYQAGCDGTHAATAA